MSGRRRAMRWTGLVVAFGVGLGAGPALSAGASRSVLKDVRYDDHPSDTLDLYRPLDAPSAPIAIYIHGGGWWNGDKGFVAAADLDRLLRAGVAVASINYRNLNEAKRDGVFPPIAASLDDARSALRFIRDHAPALAIDPKRIALFGGSAGAFNALWLGLANPDHIALRAVATVNAPTTLDPQQIEAWVGPQIRTMGQVFGLPETDFPQFLRRRAEFARFFPTLSPPALVGRDAPPLYLYYEHASDDMPRDDMFYAHDPAYGARFASLAKDAGMHVTDVEGGARDPQKRNAMLDFLIAELTRS